MRTMLIEQPYTALTVAEADEVLAEQTHPHRLTVRIGDLRSQQRRYPETTQQHSHGGAGANARQQLIILRGQHDSLLDLTSAARHGRRRRQADLYAAIIIHRGVPREGEMLRRGVDITPDAL